MVRSFAARVLPRRVRATLKRLHRNTVLTRSLDQWNKLRGAPATPELTQRLIYGWGNERFSARSEYLLAVIEHAQRTPGPILECGSGLTTVLLGLLGRHNGNRIWALEHLEPWAQTVRIWLRRYHCETVDVCLSHLHDYGTFSWYHPQPELLRQRFSLVVCDGPPGDTPGGRYGLLPVMGRALAPGCIVLLDDVKRPGEREALRRWSEELGVSYALLGSQRKFGKLTLP